MIRANEAREAHNEGMARVCARRAAGQAIQGYFSAKKFPIPTINAFLLMLDEQTPLHLPEELRPIVAHLTLRVDADYNLPAGIDLLNETAFLIKTLKNLSTQED